MGYFAKVGTISRGTPETRAAVGQIDPDLLGVENATPSCPDLTSADRSGSNSFESTPMVVTWTLENIPALRTKMRQCSQLRQRSEEHTSELQSLMRISYAVFCLKKKKHNYIKH